MASIVSPVEADDEESPTMAATPGGGSVMPIGHHNPQQQPQQRFFQPSYGVDPSVGVAAEPLVQRLPPFPPVQFLNITDEVLAGQVRKTKTICRPNHSSVPTADPIYP